MFIVTHDPNHILWFCDSVVVLGKEGTIISQGKPGDVLSKDLLEVIYGDLCDVKQPDVVFMELWVTNESEKDLHAAAIDKIEELGIPVIAFVSPSCYEEPNLETAWRQISIVGEVFNKEKEAKQLIDSLNAKIELIRERTRDISEE